MFMIGSVQVDVARSRIDRSTSVFPGFHPLEPENSTEDQIIIVGQGV